MTKQENITIIGGGAGGMFCALALCAGGAGNITILERGERLGRKLSATGNGQGNVTNLYCGIERYFTDDRAKVGRILSAFPPEKLTESLEKLGGLFAPDERGRVYPTGKQASAVTDLLRFALADRGVNVLTGVCVRDVKKTKEGFRLLTEDKKEYGTEIAVFATGGKAAKNFGTDGTGYELVKSLGHTVTPLYPALVQLKTDTTDIKSLKGIRADCAAYAFDGEKEIAHVRGDVIFTDYGISGNAVFFLSSYLTDAARPSVRLEFLPDTPKEKLVGILRKKSEKGEREDELLGCILNNQLGRAVLRRTRRETGGVPAEAVAARVKDFRLKVTGTLGFDYAQVTRGGIPMSEVTEELESKKCGGAYLCGEILNVDGECGGYNLQWAFSSAVCVARGILSRLSWKEEKK